ncbi:GatB domain protein [Anaplasma phagocytophilum]|uniref:GatB domain protein n=1 Tax=Anaplasma phagocytophilum TaxID=948 RepID=A0AA45UTV0_ANAPH|nr:GatB domain protein [Anaplasma phagocytophilum]
MNSNSGKMAKQVFATMFETGKSASKILEEEQLQQIAEDAIENHLLFAQFAPSS